MRHFLYFSYKKIYQKKKTAQGPVNKQQKTRTKIHPALTSPEIRDYSAKAIHKCGHYWRFPSVFHFRQTDFIGREKEGQN